MKTTRILNAALLLIVAVFTSVQVKAAVIGSKEMLKACRYQHTWIPSIDLKAVNIIASGTEAIKLKQNTSDNDIKSMIYLSSVNNNNSFVYNSFYPAGMNDSAAKSGIRTSVALYRNQYIPSLTLAEATIVATATNKPAEFNSVSKEDQSRFQLNARHTFTVLIDYLVEKGSELISSFFSI